MLQKQYGFVLIVLCIFLFIIPSPARSENRSEAEKVFHEAVTLNQGMPTCSRNILLQKVYFYKEAIKNYPDYAAAHNNLGDVYENLGDYQEAIKEYTLAKDIEPNSEFPCFGLGDVYSKTGRYSEAIKWYEKGLSINPKDEAALQKMKEAKDMLGEGIIRPETIASILGRKITRSTGGIRNTPRISFDENKIHFAFDSAEILPESYSQLNSIGKSLTSPNLADIRVRLAGHTDSRGTREYNQRLSVKRAESVKQYLVNQFGISSKRLITVGYGKDRPIIIRSDEESYAMNRRVELERIEKEDVAELNTPQKLTADVGFFYKNKNGKSSRIQEGMTLSSKSNYKIFFKSDKNCWLYVYKKDSSGKIDQLFPKQGSADIRNPVKAGKENWSPNPHKWFNLEGPKGRRENICSSSKRASKGLRAPSFIWKR